MAGRNVIRARRMLVTRDFETSDNHSEGEREIELSIRPLERMAPCGVRDVMKEHSRVCDTRAVRWTLGQYFNPAAWWQSSRCPVDRGLASLVTASHRALQLHTIAGAHLRHTYTLIRIYIIEGALVCACESKAKPGRVNSTLALACARARINQGVARETRSLGPSAELTRSRPVRNFLGCDGLSLSLSLSHARPATVHVSWVEQHESYVQPRARECGSEREKPARE